MPVAIPNCGTYTVELDYGASTNAIIIGDPVAGVIGSTDYFIEGQPLFVDVTTYVKAVSINRGRQNRYRDATGQPGTATIILEDRDFYFSLVNTASPYYNSTKGRLGFELNSNVRISRNGTYLFVGIISQYKQNMEKPNRSVIIVNCSDKLFTLNNIKVNQDVVVAERSDVRIGKVLTSSGLFPGASNRNLEVGVANLGTAPIDSSSSVMDYLMRVNTSEQGRIFISASGVFNFDRRLIGEFQSINAVLSDAGGTAIPFTDFEIVNS
jgi:hypothetical protein